MDNLEGLSTPSERRRQLTELLTTRAKAAKQDATSDTTGPRVAPPLLDSRPPTEPAAIKAGYERFYDGVSSQLDTGFGRFSYFLNYGYVPDGSSDESVVELPGRFFNRNSVRLVLELIGDCPIDNLQILDIGCGRGGTIYAIKKFFQPAELTGLDLSTTAIEFDRKTHGDARTSFHHGDAENLPYADQSFDVVTNIESSHSYPNIERFVAEVHRVLRPGGYLLYTDVLEVQQYTAVVAQLQRLGFRLLANRNITSNVLLSCDEVAEARVEALGHQDDPDLMRNFFATPGSQVYDEMRKGQWEYRILRAVKPQGSVPMGN